MPNVFSAYARAASHCSQLAKGLPPQKPKAEVTRKLIYALAAQARGWHKGQQRPAPAMIAAAIASWRHVHRSAAIIDGRQMKALRRKLRAKWGAAGEESAIRSNWAHVVNDCVQILGLLAEMR
jgi:hypothetical protein